MARKSRRPTFWDGSIIEDQTLAEDGYTTFEVVDEGDLVDEHSREPTLVRVIGRVGVGHTLETCAAAISVNVWFGLCLGAMNDTSLPDPRELSDDRWIWTGMCHSSSGFACYPMFTSAGTFVANTTAARHYPSASELLDFESRAMRKARTGDSLILRAYCSTSTGNPGVVVMYGAIRTLWKAQ